MSKMTCFSTIFLMLVSSAAAATPRRSGWDRRRANVGPAAIPGVTGPTAIYM